MSSPGGNVNVSHTNPPIVSIGAGGIVRDAHLPAYRKARFQVHGIYDLVRDRAQTSK